MKFGKLTLIAFGLTVGLVLLIILWAVFSNLLVAVLNKVPGLGWVDHWMILPALIFGWPMLPDRFKALHRDYAIRGSVLIDAPASVVWNCVLPRPGKAHFLNSIARVEAIEGQENAIGLVHSESLGDEPLPPLRARFEEVERLSYFRLSYENAEDFPLWAADLVSSEYFLEHMGDRTRLTLIENLDKVRFSTVLSLLFLNPCRDSARRAKALCEGTPDTSFMGRITDQIHADGSGTDDMSRSTRYVGVMMCVMVTVLFFGMIYGIMSMIAAAPS